MLCQALLQLGHGGGYGGGAGDAAEAVEVSARADERAEAAVGRCKQLARVAEPRRPACRRATVDLPDMEPEGDLRFT